MTSMRSGVLTTNPIDPIDPNFDFGPFTQTWQGVFAIVWGLCIVGALFYLLYNVFQMSKAQSSNPGRYASAKEDMIKSAVALGLLLSFSAVVGLIFLAVA